MPATWVINPVVEFEKDAFRPFVETIEDLGRPILVPPFGFKHICHSSVINTDFLWCLSLIVGEDFSEVIASGQVKRFVPQQWTQAQTRQRIKTYLDDDPLSRSWTLTQRQAFRQEFADRLVDITDLDDAQPLWRYLRRMGRRLNASFEPRKHHTFVKGVT